MLLGAVDRGIVCSIILSSSFRRSRVRFFLGTKLAGGLTRMGKVAGSGGSAKSQPSVTEGMLDIWRNRVKSIN